MFLLSNKVQTGGYKTFLHFPERSLSYAKIVQESAMRACSLIAERSLSYAKTMQTSGKKARFCFPECSLSYAKIVQERAMRACSLIAERSLSYAKIVQTLFPTKQNPLFLASPHPCLIAVTARSSVPG